MKNNMLLMFIFSFLMTNAQTQRFIYDVQYKKDSTSGLLTKENYLLDVVKNDVLYYTRDFFVADSLIANNLPFPAGMKLNPSSIISHQMGSDRFEELDIIENTVLKLQTNDSQNWTLTPEKKKVKDMTLQKATANWGGRSWIAWFTPEIPLQTGPYKFYGLPGLIVEIHDTGNNYRFELVKSVHVKETVSNQFILAAKQRGVPVDWEKYKNTKLTFYESPVGFIRSGKSSSAGEMFYLNDGTKVDAANAREINQNLKDIIKKYNNPIDLSKRIMYP